MRADPPLGPLPPKRLRRDAPRRGGFLSLSDSFSYPLLRGVSRIYLAQVDAGRGGLSVQSALSAVSFSLVAAMPRCVIRGSLFFGCGYAALCPSVVPLFAFLALFAVKLPAPAHETRRGPVSCLPVRRLPATDGYDPGS